jgi:hypothetical protein
MESPLYVDKRSILISTPKRLRRLYVPFLVLVIKDSDGLVRGEKLKVILVGFSQRDRLLYCINSRYYRYCLFIIVDQK